MHLPRLAPVTAILGLLSVSCAFGSCPIPVTDEFPAYGQELFFSEDQVTWQRFFGFTQLGSTPPNTVTFLYVLRSETSRQTTGVLVIKTGRYSDDTLAAHTQTPVHLVRNERATRLANKCDHKPFPLAGRYVSAKTYDDFHDHRGRQPGPDFQALRSFHISYETPKGCRSTDDTFDVDNEPTSRSQFSFDPQVVKNGQPSLFAGFFPTLWASSPQPSDQRSEIRRYRTDATGTTCVSFRMRPTALGRYFIRINDLDARGDPYNRRPGEKEWN